jgi:hypothetical protein
MIENQYKIIYNPTTLNQMLDNNILVDDISNILDNNILVDDISNILDKKINDMMFNVF